jgi:hypothetical protein
MLPVLPLPPMTSTAIVDVERPAAARMRSMDAEPGRTPATTTMRGAASRRRWSRASSNAIWSLAAGAAVTTVTRLDGEGGANAHE